MWNCARTSVSVLVLLTAMSMAGDTRSLAPKAEDRPLVRVLVGVSQYRSHGDFYQGEPILFRVAIERLDSGDATPSALSVGSEKEPWHGRITVRLLRVENSPAPVPSTQASSEATTRPASESVRSREMAATTVVENAKMSKYGPQTRKNELEPKKRVTSYWLLSPESSSNLPAGAYMLEAVWDNGDAKQGPASLRRTFKSKPVMISIHVPKDNVARSEVLSAQAMLLADAQKYEEATTLYQEAMKLAPERKSLHSSLGRAYQAQGDRGNAVKEYRAYIRWVRSLSDLPGEKREHLSRRADMVEREMNRLEAEMKE